MLQTAMYTAARANGIGAGAKNTAQLISLQAGLSGNLFIAASACSQYSPTVDGVMYGDWYLPSLYELNLLYGQKNLVGGFANALYWSSNEISNTDAYVQNFATGQVGSFGRSAAQRVRAIRRF